MTWWTSPKCFFWWHLRWFLGKSPTRSRFKWFKDLRYKKNELHPFCLVQVMKGDDDLWTVRRLRLPLAWHMGELWSACVFRCGTMQVHFIESIAMDGNIDFGGKTDPRIAVLKHQMVDTKKHLSRKYDKLWVVLTCIRTEWLNNIIYLYFCDISWHSLVYDLALGVRQHFSK